MQSIRSPQGGELMQSIRSPQGGELMQSIRSPQGGELQTPGHPPISFFSNLIRLFPGSSAHIQYTDLNMNIFGDQFLK